ncbi:hypothetical protein Q9966_016539 [Columba livia]|nr:hypothetical protein Q9966_016539 [Columba livia]
MGQLSSKYAGRHGVPHPSNLNELLQLWMACGSTRALMEIYSLCLAAMSGGDACVDALLDTSLQHSPHFDWVVAHIGSSFPATIINRVLACGLKDFGAHGENLQFPGGAADKRVPKIASVVGILGHLAARHGGSIKQELAEDVPREFGARAAAAQSHRPLPAAARRHVPRRCWAPSPRSWWTPCSPPMLNQLHQCLAPLPREDLDNMVTILVHLIAQTAAGAYRTLQFLVNTAIPASVITPPGGLAGPARGRPRRPATAWCTCCCCTCRSWCTTAAPPA